MKRPDQKPFESLSLIFFICVCVCVCACFSFFCRRQSCSRNDLLSMLLFYQGKKEAVMSSIMLIYEPLPSFFF